MNEQEKKDFDRIESIRILVKGMLKADKRFLLKPGERGKGRFEKCQWITAINPSNEYEMASILFYEDAVLDTRTGNLHPGQYGKVVFQKWNNQPFKRTASNAVIQIANVKGVFIPFDKNHRKETDIDVLREDKSAEEKAREVFDSFASFADFQINEERGK